MIITLKLIVLFVLAYLLGSIPSAYIAGRLKKGVDIRKAGTGNVGATNALIVAGPAIGALVYIFDVLKGVVPVLVAREVVGTDLSMGLAGLAAILGHDYSIFLKFSGGKGIATTTGVLFAINAQLMLWIFVGWCVFTGLTNYFVAASLLSTALVPITMYMWDFSQTYIIFGIVYFLIALYTHRQDTVRIIWGREKKARDSIKKFFKKEKLV
ncbi:glycerol-3-phosphate 1-O-acyltransferase PlsY [Candidatus Margulisiibacteriota bacterium]